MQEEERRPRKHVAIIQKAVYVVMCTWDKTAITESSIGNDKLHLLPSNGLCYKIFQDGSIFDVDIPRHRSRSLLY